MFTYNVGPSQISENTKQDIREAIQNDILQISHRSEEFTNISKQAILGLREFFQIPDEYRVFYTSSATEAMKLSLENACQKKSFHFVCGAFSKVFASFSESLGNETIIDEVELGQINDFQKADISDDVDFMAITHNETSTGVMCLPEDIKFIRQKHIDKILAVDITSSAGATDINIQDADIWFFSVQKCFGLPAGLGILIVSPKAFEKSLKINNKKNKFSFEAMQAKMQDKFQTPQTPNVLNVYLLAQKINRWNKRGGLKNNIILTKEKKEIFDKFVNAQNKLKHFVQNEKVRSDTIFYLKGNEKDITELHQKALDNNLILGKGYGELKKEAIRIANFLNITKQDLEKVIKLL